LSKKNTKKYNKKGKYKQQKKGNKLQESKGSSDKVDKQSRPPYLYRPSAEINQFIGS